MVRTGLLAWFVSSVPVSVLIGRMIATRPAAEQRAQPAYVEQPRLRVLVSAGSSRR